MFTQPAFAWPCLTSLIFLLITGLDLLSIERCGAAAVGMLAEGQFLWQSSLLLYGEESCPARSRCPSAHMHVMDHGSS